MSYTALFWLGVCFWFAYCQIENIDPFTGKKR